MEAKPDQGTSERYEQEVQLISDWLRDIDWQDIDEEGDSEDKEENWGEVQLR